MDRIKYAFSLVFGFISLAISMPFLILAILLPKRLSKHCLDIVYYIEKITKKNIFNKFDV